MVRTLCLALILTTCSLNSAEAQRKSAPKSAPKKSVSQSVYVQPIVKQTIVAPNYNQQQALYNQYLLQQQRQYYNQQLRLQQQVYDYQAWLQRQWLWWNYR